MKSILIATFITTLVAAIPSPPINSDQPAPDLALAAGKDRPCYHQCKHHCLKVYSVLLTSPLTAPFVVWRCKHKCRKECDYEFDHVAGAGVGDMDEGEKVEEGDGKDAILDLVKANGTIEFDVEKLKEALDMDMDMDMVD